MYPDMPRISVALKGVEMLILSVPVSPVNQYRAYVVSSVTCISVTQSHLADFLCLTFCQLALQIYPVLLKIVQIVSISSACVLFLMLLCALLMCFDAPLLRRFLKTTFRDFYKCFVRE